MDRVPLYLNRASAALILSVLSWPATAATFCASSTAQIQQALSTAQSNGEDDVVYIVVGTYLVGSELQYNAATSETFRINIIGGQPAGCSGPPDPAASTVLDGQELVRQLSVSAAGPVSIGYLSFVHGHPSQYAGGALNLANSSASATTTVFDNVFVANTGPISGGALFVSAVGDVYLWSNVMLANHGAGAWAAYLSDSGNTYVNGNTIVRNQSTGQSGLGAVDIAGTGEYWFANNIVWNNDAWDVYDQSGSVHYAYNDIGTMSGFPPLSQTHELSIDPDFSGFFGVSLAPASPLVNAGLDDPPGFAGGCCDPTHGPRIIGAHVDIGAYESDVLFRNGYEAGS